MNVVMTVPNADISQIMRRLHRARATLIRCKPIRRDSGHLYRIMYIGDADLTGLVML